MESVISSSLCRFKITDEHLITDEIVKDEISRAFDELRCFEFYLDADVVKRIRDGDPAEFFRERFLDMRNGMIDILAREDQTVRNRMLSDTRLSSRLISAIAVTHRAAAEGNYSSLHSRRFVIVKERPGAPTMLHVSGETTVISHVGQGPPWAEVPTIYLGLNTFDAIVAGQKRKSSELFSAFMLLLMIEERAIETGYTHGAVYPPEVFKALNLLVEEVIRSASREELEEIEEAVEKRKPRKFTRTSRRNLIRDLDARVVGDEFNFDYERNMKAMKSLERLARIYKAAGDRDSVREILRILVAASGHDVHEVRNRANLVLERMLAPKEFDAPLSSRFLNLRVGDSHRFEFELPGEGQEYYLRFCRYKNSKKSRIISETDITNSEVRLSFDAPGKKYYADCRFDEFGHFDYTVVRKSGGKSEWLKLSDTSGRVNVIPDVRGEVILEVFTDIHGHTKSYWHDNTGHPGLLYNENGEVIRLGRFSDIAEHLDQIKSKYHITGLYLLGVQKRGSNREDWAFEASSPSPFSPLSLVDIEPTLGGDAEFKDLVDKAHSLGIRVIVDIIPHINRRSDHLPDDLCVMTYDGSGNLVQRASTDGRYGSWNDGKLLNYRKFEIWEWLADSIDILIEKFGIDGIRFDSAHAVPIMMKKNNYPYVYNRKRTPEEMIEGNIIVNDREDGHFITTGYYDCACRDVISVPIHYYLMLRIEKKIKELKRNYFIYIAECYWGHERFLARTGIIPYNSSLFKICENIIHGKTDVREIYHIYDNYFPSVLPRGTELLGILGNHDERRGLNTFGHRGLRAATALTIFMSNIIMDYEGSAEGEGWKVYLDNIYVNWNQFEYAAHRSLESFYSVWYRFHRDNRGNGYLVWANNTNVAAAAMFTDECVWIGSFNFADSNQAAAIQFDSPVLPIHDDSYYILSDPLFSITTGNYSYYSGRELKISRINTVVSYTDRVKLLRLDPVKLEDHYSDFLRDSYIRLCEMPNTDRIMSNFAFMEMAGHIGSYEAITAFILEKLVPIFLPDMRNYLELGLKRASFYFFKKGLMSGDVILQYSGRMSSEKNEVLRGLGESLILHNQRGALVFMSAEADPFSKSGGLANVVYELPRELAKLGEDVCVITCYYRYGDDKAVKKMQSAVEKYGVEYSGVSVRFKIMEFDYEIGVHTALVDGVRYYLLDHYEFFDGLYWGYTAEEKLRRRIAFARACAEVILLFDIRPHFTFTNDAYIGLFNGIVRCDPYYSWNPNFQRNKFLHIIHNGGWQYFDAYNRHENNFDLFTLFNLPFWRAGEFCDPVFSERLNCMATGIRFADKVITVSPSYARQIEYACDGLERILRNVVGISNAIGRDFREKLVKQFRDSGFVDNNYRDLLDRIKEDDDLNAKLINKYPEILKGLAHVDSIKDEKRKYIVKRMANKLMLQMQKGLKIDPDLILCTFIHRICEQKGFQLLLDASEGVFKNLGFQAIIGGSVSSGDKKGEEIAHGLYKMGQYYQEQVSVSIGFQEISVPLLSCDIFLMPSMHEPGGISQLEAFAAGALVLARATGGLRDTVTPVRIRGEGVEGNGFLFSDYNPASFYDAMERASYFFRSSDDDTIYKARKNAESSVYYWDRPARQYVETVYNLTETIRILKPSEE
ncbi:MAG: glycogen/starch synthase [Spirochaetes bacterium]|nr:glycogen/starch synthase [Spirochaetota bacterium]